MRHRSRASPFVSDGSAPERDRETEREEAVSEEERKMTKAEEAEAKKVRHLLVAF